MWFSLMREWPSESLQGSRQRKNSININFTLPISAREGGKRTDWLFSSPIRPGFNGTINFFLQMGIPAWLAAWRGGLA